MAKLYHPTILGHAIEVPEPQADDWVAQGWLTEPIIIIETDPEGA